jgi:hypothetical protein
VSAYLVICPTAPGRLDGVADYACWLTAHLDAFGPAHLVGLEEGPAGEGVPDTRGLPAVRRVALDSWRDLWRNRRRAPLADGAAIVQYVPQLYLRRPDSLWLLLWMASLRLRGRMVTVTVHEYAVPGGSLTRAAARAAMLAVMLIVGGLASRLVVTFELPRRRLARLLFWKARRIAVIPVGANIAPGERPAREAKGAVVGTIFGQPEAMSAALVSATATWRREHESRLRLRWIGRSRAAIERFLRDRCGVPPDAVDIVEGAPATGVATVLASSDLYLAPIADGVSTRRTTVVTALASGLPVVGTDGLCTDEVFRQSAACRLSGPEDPAAFVRHLAAVVNQGDLRARMGEAARALFEERFSWHHIARAYVAHMAA